MKQCEKRGRDSEKRWREQNERRDRVKGEGDEQGKVRKEEGDRERKGRYRG